MVLYAATTNAGKIRDFAAAGGGTAGILPLPGMREMAEPVEDAPDFTGNARLKAIYYSRQTPGLRVMADDSGLEVDALNGAPGVRSARFADDHGIEPHSKVSRDQRNNNLLLSLLQQKPNATRTARFICVLAVALDGEILYIAEGAVQGEILAAPRGENGFGYDPIFLLPKLGKTMAELASAEKWEHSHRGRAFRELIRKLTR